MGGSLGGVCRGECRASIGPKGGPELDPPRAGPGAVVFMDAGWRNPPCFPGREIRKNHRRPIGETGPAHRKEMTFSPTLSLGFGLSGRNADLYPTPNVMTTPMKKKFIFIFPAPRPQAHQNPPRTTPEFVHHHASDSLRFSFSSAHAQRFLGHRIPPPVRALSARARPLSFFPLPTEKLPLATEEIPLATESRSQNGSGAILNYTYVLTLGTPRHYAELPSVAECRADTVQVPGAMHAC